MVRRINQVKIYKQYESIMASICIADYEYKERVQRAAAILRREGLDALIVTGNDADYAHPLYFSVF